MNQIPLLWYDTANRRECFLTMLIITEKLDITPLRQYYRFLYRASAWQTYDSACANNEDSNQTARMRAVWSEPSLVALGDLWDEEHSKKEKL